VPNRRKLRRRDLQRAFDHGQPIRRIPFAPFVVLAALGPMLVAMTTSKQAHVVLIDLPQPTPPPLTPGRHPVHRIFVTAEGMTFIDGHHVQRSKLAEAFAALRTGPIGAEVVFEPAANAPYDAVLPVLGELKHRGLAEQPLFCFGNLQLYRTFDKAASRSTVPYHAPPPNHLSSESGSSPSCSEMNQPVP
jgi:biopolymer transport protein ExbD